MPTLAAVNLAFNSVYNCMAFWFQVAQHRWNLQNVQPMLCQYVIIIVVVVVVVVIIIIIIIIVIIQALLLSIFKQ